MTTKTVETIDYAEQAKRAAAEAAELQRKAAEAQALAEAAELKARARRQEARQRYAHAVIDSYSANRDAARKAIKKAEDVFRDAVLSGKESAARYSDLLKARTDLYVIEQEHLDAHRILGKERTDRTNPPQPRFFTEAEQIIVQASRAHLSEALEDMRDRREQFIAREVSK